MDRKRSRTPLVLVLLALCATASAAQEFRGAVTGRVTDSSGLVVPGATVTVMNTATGVAATATTNEAGSFTVPYLTPGSYTVAFELTGFYKVVRSVELRVGDRLEVDATLQPGARAVVGTGIAVEIPEGYAGFVQPRSGLAARHGIGVVNSPGLVDSGYRGELRVVLLNTDRETTFSVEPGMRIAQLVVVPVPAVRLLEVEELEASERGGRGFGSTAH